MKRLLLLIHFLALCLLGSGQAKPMTGKYPSLFWEISGNGLKKPSYLFGTMHVSSKVAFHLSDTFYVAIRNAEVVALETNPETWQEDMNKYDQSAYYNSYGSGYDFMDDPPEDYLNIQTLRIPRYEKKLEAALFSRPVVINNLLYRSNSDQTADFEEDTYLDMYIFQTGKRLGKRVAGVEDYGESMRLMTEAYKDAAKEINKKEKSYDFDEEYSPQKLQEVYRAGNLDKLDSINKLSSQSEAFDEKFLYRRNEIQANSIDSILKRSTLFAGVGAAHLPGERGVIELLRKKGYKLRPIFMKTRDGRQKDAVEKIRVPVVFNTQSSPDGFYKADIPGKFYTVNESFFTNQQQYADMANGSYYMVTRVKTNSMFWGHEVNTVAKKIDSLLYENVPGKIISKTEINRNGYRGFDITNLTRRGDYHRYNIFITPNEVLFFKMGGNGEYVVKGDEAKFFFGSLQLKELKSNEWKKFSPAYGGFSVDLPQEPTETFNGNVQYDIEDRMNSSHYTIIRTDIHNYNFAEADSFDLDLMNESFASSEFIDKTISRKQTMHKGYPALNCNYLHKDGSVLRTMFIIRGPHYYTLVAHSKNEKGIADNFFNSFQFTPFAYKELKSRTDTSLGYIVNTTWFPSEGEDEVKLSGDDYMPDDEDETGFSGLFEKDDMKARYIKNDTTGEAVFVEFYRTPRYFYTPDSSLYENNQKKFLSGLDSTWIIRSMKSSVSPKGMKVFEVWLSDTNSSRAIHVKSFLKDGISFGLTTHTDTLSEPSSFIKYFYENFIPADTLKGANPFEKKSTLFFADLFSTDSSMRKRALRSASQFEADSSDIDNLAKAIRSFNWEDKNYLERKIIFISKLGSIPVNRSTDILKQLYFDAGDTAELQHAVLEAMLKHRTTYAYNTFRSIMIKEPPVIEENSSGYTIYPPLSSMLSKKNYFSDLSNGDFMDELYDSLLLTRSILPDLLPLINLDDYKWPVMRLLEKMVDSNLVQGKDYEMYYSKFLLEARQALKKHNSDEKKTAIEKAEQEKKQFKTDYNLGRDAEDEGNENLSMYATLLLPFRKNNPAVDDLIGQLLSANDKRLKYNTAYLLLKNAQPLPDTLLNYFVAMDEYRYELFTDLRKLKMTDRFPSAYKNIRDIARSKLMSSSYYEKPDSLVFLDSLSATYKGRTGLVYFFKYKMGKDDSFWKLASTGLMSVQPGEFIIEEKEQDNIFSSANNDVNYYNYMGKSNEFTEFTDVKIKDEEPMNDQLNKQLKKILYSKRKSGASFYRERPDPEDMPSLKYYD